MRLLISLFSLLFSIYADAQNYKLQAPCIDTSFTFYNEVDTALIGGVPSGGLADQYYPASAVKDKKTGKIIWLAKTDGNLRFYSSPDGQNKITYHPTLGIMKEAGTKTKGKLETNIMRQSGDSTYVLYGAFDSTFAPYYKQQFLAVSNNALGTYTTYPNDPIIDTSIMQGYGFSDICDMKVMPDGSHLYYVMLYNFTNDWRMCTYTSPAGDWRNLSFDRWITKISSSHLISIGLHPCGGKVLQKGSVIKRNGYYYMLLTAGCDSNVPNQRRGYLAISPDPYNFEPLSQTIVDVGPVGGQNDMRVYNFEFLFAQNKGYWELLDMGGLYHLYYSATNVGETLNKGQTYLVRFANLPCVELMSKAD